ncbi:MAG TPA: DNA internalization-related competence protein ComEC/Rec2 [Anaerovoracaceae bacterium]|nr:DNA internalization-related competence protein ComEC/Rec2 [Anaerovoracaceae bacterium]
MKKIIMQNEVRRPITFVLIAFAGGIFFGRYLQIWLCVLLFAALLIFSIAFKECGSIWVFILIAIIGSTYFSLTDRHYEPLLDFEDKPITVKGSVLAVKDKETHLQILLGPSTWEYGKIPGATGKKMLVNIYCGQEDIENEIASKLIGSKVRIKGKFALPAVARNPGLFDYRLHLKTRRIIGIINADDSNVMVIGKRPMLAAAPGKLKAKFVAILDRRMDEDSKALLIGLLFGDKTMISEDIYENFQRNGCGHILSVSGIHVSIVYVYISRIFSNRRNLIGSCCALVLLVFYAALAEFSPSVMRAVTMIAIHIVSVHLHRRYDLLCCISLSALIQLLLNPYHLFGIGFQLSYLAVFTLAFALPILESKLQKTDGSRKNKSPRTLFFNILAPLFVIQLGMAPATAFHFMYFSFSAFVLNPPIIFLAGLAVPLGIGMALLSVIPQSETLMVPGFACLELIINIMIKINLYAGSICVSSMNVIAPSVFILTAFYGFLFFFTSEGFWICLQKRRWKRISILCVAILFFSALTPLITGEWSKKGDMVFLDVGQGDCIHVRTPSGKNILIDGGGSRNYDVGKKTLMPYLLKNGVSKVDLALVTHLHQDHYAGIASLCKIMPVHTLAVYDGNILREEEITIDTDLGRDKILYLKSGDKIQLEDDIHIEILYPKKHTMDVYEKIMADEEDENLSCLVMKICYKGVSALITGDIGFEGEAMLLEASSRNDNMSLKTDVLKVGHHGSRFSTGNDFIEAVNPKVAIIQVGKNNFGHPHPDVIEKLSEKGIMIYRNDSHGAVILNIGNGGLKIHTMLNLK